MAKEKQLTMYLQGCHLAIRKAVFGREIRKPVVDLLKFYRDDIEGYEGSKSEQMDMILDTMERKTESLDNVFTFDGAAIQQISDDDYQLIL